MTKPDTSIDVGFDFTTDAHGFWDEFWDYNDCLGYMGTDPDAVSKTLRRYHQILWSRELPCGQVMDLRADSCANDLTWNGFRFGSDTVLSALRYRKNEALLRQIQNKRADYRNFMESTLREFYTIGGTIIFPKHRNSINQLRACNERIADRWDLTMECIRRYYCGEESPLGEVLENDADFFDLFVDFKGYVDYFYLNDCVSEDYSRVCSWLGTPDFTESPLPKTPEEYLAFIDHQLDFVHKRNARIKNSFR